MALSLKSNRSYSLLKGNQNGTEKQVYFVKLTDSCLRALEEHLAYQAATKGRPSIRFNGQSGKLHIPSKPGSASQDVGKIFNFACANLQRDVRQGILECIHQPCGKEETLVSLGTLQNKISIMATEDVYEMTRNKMAQANQERQEVRTKEIKINHTKRKTKKVPIIASVNPKLNAAVKNKLANNCNPKHSSSKPLTTANGNSSSKSVSFKDRVIHYLAVRPYKKPEIILRLQKDNVNWQKEKIILSTILQQIATMQNNTFTLKKDLLSDVKPDSWPFYTEFERQLVKQNISRLDKQDTSPQPLVSSTSKSPEDKGTKRPLNDDSHPMPKKPRIAKPLQDPLTSSSDNTGKHNRSMDDKRKKVDSKPVVATDKNGTNENGTNENGTKENGTNENGFSESPPTVASTSEMPEYLIKYTPIINYEQRCKYKQDFQSEYDEYRKLKENVDAVSKKFMELDRSWKRHHKDSKEAQLIQEQIYSLYEQHQKIRGNRRREEAFQRDQEDMTDSSL